MVPALLFALALLLQPTAGGPAETTCLLRFAPPAGRQAEYQGVFHGTVKISKLPGEWELNGRMRLGEEIPEVDPSGISLQRFTFRDAAFRFGGMTIGFNLKGESLIVRRGPDQVATELVRRPPAASVESGDVLGVVASLPWSVVFPARRPLRVGESWSTRLDPAPPDIGQPIGPETYRPRLLTTENTLAEIREREGRRLAVLNTTMVIREKFESRNYVKLAGEAGYWLDTGELAYFDAGLDLFVAVDVSGHEVTIRLFDATVYFEEREPSEITLELPPRGPSRLTIASGSAPPLYLRSYPIDPRALAAAGLTVPDGAKPYVLDARKLHEIEERKLSAMATSEERAAARERVDDYIAGTTLYAYRSEQSVEQLASWLAGLPGVTVEPVPSGGARPAAVRVSLPGSSGLAACVIHHKATDRRYLIISDSEAIINQAIALAGPPPKSK